MFGFSEKIRWIFFILGSALLALWLLDHRGLLNNYTWLSTIVFPYIWALGLAFMFIGYGIPKKSNKPSSSVDSTPGLGDKKDGPFGGSPFGGDGGGSSGGGGD